MIRRLAAVVACALLFLLLPGEHRAEAVRGLGIAPLPIVSPLSVPGSILWLDGADSSTVTITSGKISQWNDKSAAGGNNATEATAGIRPVLTAAAQNNLSCVTAASGTALQIASFALGGTPSGITTFWVGKGTWSQTSLAVEQSANAGSCTGMCFWLADVSTNGNVEMRMAGSTANNNANGSFTPGSPLTTLIGQMDTVWDNTIGGGGTSQIATRVNRSAQALTAIHNSTATTGVFTNNTTLNFFSRNNTGSTFPWAGTLCEFIVYKTALAPQQVQQVEGYLARKWALP